MQTRLFRFKKLQEAGTKHFSTSSTLSSKKLRVLRVFWVVKPRLAPKGPRAAFLHTGRERLAFQTARTLDLHNAMLHPMTIAMVSVSELVTKSATPVNLAGLLKGRSPSGARGHGYEIRRRCGTTNIARPLEDNHIYLPASPK
jgi:hypothetical protein